MLPDPTTDEKATHLVQVATETRQQALALQVRTPREYEQVSEFRKTVKAKFNEIEGYRTYLKEPYLEGGRRVDEFFKPPLQALKEAEDKARAEREEADRIAAEERAAAQAVIDAERAKLKRQADELEAARLAEEKRKADEEAAKIKPLVSGYSIVIKNAGKGRFVGLWLNEKDVEQYRTVNAHETEEECLAMVKSFISGEGRA